MVGKLRCDKASHRIYSEIDKIKGQNSYYEMLKYISDYALVPFSLVLTTIADASDTVSFDLNDKGWDTYRNQYLGNFYFDDHATMLKHKPDNIILVWNNPNSEDYDDPFIPIKTADDSDFKYLLPLISNLQKNKKVAMECAHSYAFNLIYGKKDVFSNTILP